jgi:hypothetical protein
MGFYTGDRPGQTPGLVPMAGDFNWWEGGAMFGQVSLKSSVEFSNIANDLHR